MHSLHAIFEYHQSMLADAGRVAAFERALGDVVRPDAVVADIGAGTGLLAMLACRAGARRVYAIERGEVASLAAEVIRANRLEERITLVRGESSSISLPERVDVVAGEIIGNAGLDEGIIGTFLDARARFLKPGGRLVPRRVRVWAAPCETPEVYAAAVEFWRSRPAGLELGPLAGWGARQMYIKTARAEALRAPAVPVLEIDLETTEELFAAGGCVFRIDRACTVHGLALGFEAELAPGVMISNAPPNPIPSWNHRFLPLAAARRVAEGARLALRLSTRDGAVWRWQTRWGEGPDSGDLRWEADQSTFAGFPLSLLEIRTSSDDARPGSSERTEAARMALGRMAEGKSIAEIADELAGRFATALPTAAAARSFVRELARGYGGRGG